MATTARSEAAYLLLSDSPLDTPRPFHQIQSIGQLYEKMFSTCMDDAVITNVKKLSTTQDKTTYLIDIPSTTLSVHSLQCVGSRTLGVQKRYYRKWSHNFSFKSHIILAWKGITGPSSWRKGMVPMSELGLTSHTSDVLCVFQNRLWVGHRARRLSGGCGMWGTVHLHVWINLLIDGQQLGIDWMGCHSKSSSMQIGCDCDMSSRGGHR